MSAHVLIAVPPHLATAVAELIARDGQPEEKPKRGQATLVNGWDEESLRDHFRHSSPKMRGFMVFLAENEGTEVSSEQAAKAVGYPDWNSIAGMLGAAGRRAHNNYGLDDGPWDRRWDEDDRSRFRMPADVAAIVLDEAGR